MAKVRAPSNDTGGSVPRPLRIAGAGAWQARREPVGAPLPDIADHVVETETIRFEDVDRAGAPVAVDPLVRRGKSPCHTLQRCSPSGSSSWRAGTFPGATNSNRTVSTVATCGRVTFHAGTRGSTATVTPQLAREAPLEDEGPAQALAVANVSRRLDEVGEVAVRDREDIDRERADFDFARRSLTVAGHRPVRVRAHPKPAAVESDHLPPRSGSSISSHWNAVLWSWRSDVAGRRTAGVHRMLQPIADSTNFQPRLCSRTTCAAARRSNYRTRRT